MVWPFRNSRDKALHQLKEIREGVMLMRDSFSIRGVDMKKFQRGLLQFYRARRRLANIVDIDHIISGSKEWKKKGKVADDILHELSYFEGTRKRIREIYEGKLPLNELKKFAASVERSWLSYSEIYHVPGENLVEEYQKAVMQYL